jgi:flavin-dependent dehydrogenase
VTDVLVVGSGPAGSVTALLLARAGVVVRMVDRDIFPRHKLCGDTLNPGSLAILDRLGLGPAVRAASLPVAGMILTGPRGARVSADYPGGLAGAAIRRRDLDWLLVEAATAAGVAFDPGVLVRGPALSADGARVLGAEVAGRARPRVLRARLTVAADGRGSRLASGLRLAHLAQRPRRWAFGGYFAGVAGLDARGEMHIRHRSYLGIAPLSGGEANVCAVYEAADGRPAPRVDRRRAIADLVATDPELRERFARAALVSEVASLGPLAVESRGSGWPGLLLAGDAAGFVDPMTGDGLRFALRGAELAAEAALRELASGVPAARDLHAARAREFAVKWRLNRTIRAVVGSRPALWTGAALARRWSAPVRYLIGVAGDVHTVGTIPTPRIPSPASHTRDSSSTPPAGGPGA